MYYKVIISKAEVPSLAAILLEKDLEQYLDEGWKPIGGISMSIKNEESTDYYVYMAQAIIKESNNKNE